MTSTQQAILYNREVRSPLGAGNDPTDLIAVSPISVSPISARGSCRAAKPGLGPYAPQSSTTLLPKLSVTSKVSARTSCAWVGSRVRFRSSEDVTLLEFTSPVDREYMRRCQKFH